ncbi:MAG: Stf0 family sulfotransferase [Flavobacteriales bacterium]
MKNDTNSYFSFHKYFDYSERNIDLLKSKFPSNDFIDVKYDQNFATPIKKVIVLFSTERSGSTFFCETLHQSKICLMHEYLQPYNYMPVIAQRWEAIDNGKVNIPKFWQQLKKYRVSKDGVLGINLHGSHIYLFEQMLAHLGEVDIEYFYIKRKNTLSQAISYEIASQNQAWSSEFKNNTPTLSYNFESILQKIRRLEHDNLKVRIFIEKNKLDVNEFYLENFIENKNKFILDNFAVDIVEMPASLKKQASNINENWRSRFIADFNMRSDVHGTHKNTEGTLSSLLRSARKIKKIIMNT